MNQPSREYTDLPEALKQRLAERDRVLHIVAPAADRSVLGLASAHFAGRPRAARRLRRWRLPAAIAASIVFALLVIGPAELFGPGPASRDDIDGSGQVDILDVFALARMRADGSLGPGRDVDALAERIVALGVSP